MSGQAPLPAYGLYAERDGIACCWPEFDSRGSEESALTQLPGVRSELATMNAAFEVQVSFIHLLRHDGPNCDCLANEQPGDDCIIVKTFAPDPGATEAQDQKAAAAWLADRAEAAGVGQADLVGLVHDAAAAEASDVNNDGIRAQTAFLLRQFGQEEAVKLIATEVDALGNDD